MKHRMQSLVSPCAAGIAVTLLVLLGAGCGADTEDTEVEDVAATATESPPLRSSKVVDSDGDAVRTALVVKLKSWLKDGSELRWVPEDTEGALTLRTYGSPKDASRIDEPGYLSDDDNLDWTIPGPTFRIRHGQAFHMKLINRLPPQDDMKCKEDSPDFDVLPDCFHGNNTTNFHFHGFRISPEPPQDWVFLKLRPEGSDEDPEDPDVVVGEYDFHVDPIRDIQPVGTHWYHAHKHGSTALQVVNGMAGAFLVEGYFDEYLEEQIPGLEEKVLVVQQINEAIPFPNRNPVPDESFWVNGRLNPVIELKKGQIQRWRFVGATQQASAQILLSFPFEARQIAQDGVPFANENYQRQSLDLSREGAFFAETFQEANLKEDMRELLAAANTPLMQLASGNRVDVLVRAPEEPGDYPVTLDILANLVEELKAKVEDAEDTPLVTLRVVDEEDPMEFPAELPPLPDYLRDIEEVPGEETTVVFSMDKGGGNQPEPPQFFIDGEKYDPDRIDHRVVLERNEQWVLENVQEGAALPTVAHPFHIHVNPFQIVAVNGRELPKPWIWWDTIALPVQAPPDQTPSVTIRQRFLGFTGEYVLHCHILGHEDRGMMQNVLAEAGGE